MNTPETPDSSPQWAMDLARTVPGINHFGSQAEIETLVGNIARALQSTRAAAFEEAIAACEREQRYREYRCDEVGDQDGSGVGACKEIAGYLRVCLIDQEPKK